MEDIYFPRSPREKVIVYRLLSELRSLTDNTHIKILGINPICSDNIPKSEIHKWINDYHNRMEKEDEL